ncbi:MAG: hypothetical protein ACR2P4_02995 [Gammaproteobacteria bacterium]
MRPQGRGIKALKGRPKTMAAIVKPAGVVFVLMVFAGLCPAKEGAPLQGLIN